MTQTIFNYLNHLQAKARQEVQNLADLRRRLAALNLADQPSTDPGQGREIFH